MRFRLHQHTDLLIGVFRVVGDAPPARGPGTGHAADALGRVTRGLHNGARLLGSVHHRRQDGLHTQVQVLLDEGGSDMPVPDRHPGDGVRRRIGRNGLQLRQNRIQIVGCMLAIDQEPVKTGTGADLGRIRIGQPQPEPDLQLLLGQRALERIDRMLHDASPAAP